MHVAEIYESSITLTFDIDEAVLLALACRCGAGQAFGDDHHDEFETLASFFEALAISGSVYGLTNDERYQTPLESIRAGKPFWGIRPTAQMIVKGCDQ